MIQTLSDDGTHMIVRQRIKNRFPFPAGTDELGIFQDLQLMGHRRLRHAKTRGQIADADLRLKQNKQQPDTGGVAEDLEKFRQIV